MSRMIDSFFAKPQYSSFSRKQTLLRLFFLSFVIALLLQTTAMAAPTQNNHNNNHNNNSHHTIGTLRPLAAFVTTSIASKRSSSAVDKQVSIMTKQTTTSTTTFPHYMTTNPNNSSPSSSSFSPLPPPHTKNDNDNNHIMKAWTCHGQNQMELVHNLAQANIITSEQVFQVMTQIDRSNYFYSNNNDDPYLAYRDAPQSIGYGQTISAPHMHAHVLEEFLPHVLSKQQQHELQNSNTCMEPLKILDVGCGSGYLTAAFGRWVHSKNNNDEDDSTPTISTTNTNILNSPNGGKVWGIDVHSELVDRTRTNIQKQDSDLLLDNIVDLQVGDGWKGLPSEAPFDMIHVGAAATEFPLPLLMQLRIQTGVLIIPVGPTNDVQILYKVERLRAPSSLTNNDDTDNSEWYTNVDLFDEGDFRITKLLGVKYVPLIHP